MSEQAVENLELFAEEVRDFLSDNLSERLRIEGANCAGIYADKPVALEWLQILNNQGWAVPHWPVEYGGTGWSLAQHHIFQHECVLTSAPRITPNATHMVGPVLMKYGTDKQKNELLPRIRSGEDWWAQGYSEPGSGSDLASLQCRAESDGDDYIINGSKIWTTHAHFSNKMFALVRTDSSGRKQQGITFLLLDLDLPGISIRPLISISGDHEFNQVFFEDVRVPKSGLVGEENDGWTVAKYLLEHERAGTQSPSFSVALERIRAFVAKGDIQHRSDLASDPSFQLKAIEVEMQISNLEAIEVKILSSINAGEPVGALSSLMKIQISNTKQAVSELGLRATEHYAAPFQPDARLYGSNFDPIGPKDAVTFVPKYLNDRAATIYGGSNEIQKNIIAKQLIGL